MSEIKIARKNSIKKITEVADKIDLKEDDLELYGKYKAKISESYLSRIKNSKEKAKLVLVTAINPTPAGEGKTTATIGLGDAMNKIGNKTLICLREPSLGPCFGMKGGATGGGYSQIIPMEDINLHFTGDIHAITSANNLLSAMIDNHIKWDNELNIKTVTWKRAVDLNDRALRNIEIGHGKNNGEVRVDGFNISVASEIMAIFCLATDLKDLENKISNIIIGYDVNDKKITAKDLNAVGSIMVLLKDAFLPNLVQTLEHNPVLIHGGPFANIAHGCNSVIATKTALKISDYVITEAGFGADLGAEKFFNIKCRKANLKPDAVVIVATARALKFHGGGNKFELASMDIEALKKGICNLDKHIENMKKFGLNPIVAINKFAADSKTELDLIKSHCEAQNVKAILCENWGKGGEGSIELAEEVVNACEEISNFAPIYSDDKSLTDKIKIIAKEIYGADNIELSETAKEKLDFMQNEYGHLPICIAKTQYSLSDNPKLLGRAEGFNLKVSDVALSAGAGFIVVKSGNIMTMPGLPRKPAAEEIYLDEKGLIQGLF